MWNEIVTYTLENLGYILVAIVVPGFLIKKYIYDKWKKKKFEKEVPKTKLNKPELRDQPNYNPYFKAQEEQMIPKENRLNEVYNKIEKIKSEGKALAIESKRIEDWNREQGKRYIELINKINIKEKKINDSHSIWTNYYNDTKRHLDEIDKFNKGE